MLKEALSVARFQNYSAASLVMFILIIAIVTLWIFRPSANDSYEQIAKNILEK